MAIYKSPVSAWRKQFEEWYVRSHGASVVRTRKGYVVETTRVAWRAWQARAELELTHVKKD